MKSFPIQRLSRGFTLIELLIVISIIAVLATVSVPVTKNVLNKARSTSAQNDCMQVQSAIRGYYSEYFSYPVRGESEGPYKTDGDSSIMDVLMSNNTSEAENMNKRKIEYFEAFKMAKSAKLPGFHVETGRFNDPWGQPYEIYMDADDDGELTIPAIYGAKFGRSGRIKKTVFMHSGGPDGDLDTVGDNVSSWD